LFEELINIGDLIVDFGAYLREGYSLFVAPGLGGPLGDIHQLDELTVVDEGLVGCELLYPALNLLDPG
jgi:hypothetical protein